MLKKRILTAAILIPIVLGVLFYLPPLSFRILTSFIVLGGAWEWAGLMGLQSLFARFGYFVFMEACLFIILLLPEYSILLTASIWWIMAAYMVIAYPSGSQFLFRHRWAKGLMGILTLAPCWVAINSIRLQADGLYALLFLFILIWGADSAAYFVGKQWGKHKLAPKVSPGKSWEGFLGALLFTIFIVIIACGLSHTPMKLWPWAILLSLVTVIFSVIGDLFESMLKRHVGVKDSGHLLPGHGGLLDRIDSLTAAAPIFAFGAALLSQYVN